MIPPEAPRRPSAAATWLLATLWLLTGSVAAAQETVPDSAVPPPDATPVEDPLGPDWLAPDDEPFGRLAAEGWYEIRSLETDSLLGREDWQLFEDEAGFRTLRSTLSLQATGGVTSRQADVTVTPELAFVEADLGSSGPAGEAYGSFRREGDLLRVEAFGYGGETTQAVSLPPEGVFVSQLFATRGWELAAFEGGDDGTRLAYVAGSAPGVLVGEVRRLSANARGLEVVDVGAGRFQTFLVEIDPVDAEPASESEAQPDRWWVLTSSRLPAAAELPTLGVRLELVGFDQDPQPSSSRAPGPILARGVYHHRPLRRVEPLAVESFTLSAEPGGGFRLESQLSYADGRALLVRAVADSLLHVRDLQLRRRQGRRGETVTLRMLGGAITAEARGGGVGLARQVLAGEPPILVRLDVAALDGWAVRDRGEPIGSTYWLPGGAHPLGTLLQLPAEVELGRERLPTPARTFETRRFASPAETPPLFRSIRWIFGAWRLPARVVFPALGREAILVRYETPDPDEVEPGGGSEGRGAPGAGAARDSGAPATNRDATGAPE